MQTCTLTGDATKSKCCGNDIDILFCTVLGVMEIKKCIDALSMFSRTVPQTLDIMPLHAALTPKEQNSIFAPVRKGVRKIVVATNVAATSITM